MTHATQIPKEELAMLEVWLRETGELFVTVYPPLRVFRNVDPPRFGVAFFLHSVAEIEEIVETELQERALQQRRIGLGVRVYRRLQYALRGVAGPDFLEQLLTQITEDEHYEIVSLSHYPHPLNPIGWAHGRQEFEEEFAKIAGERIGVGLWGVPKSDESLEWCYEHQGDRYELVGGYAR